MLWECEKLKLFLSYIWMAHGAVPTQEAMGFVLHPGPVLSLRP